MKLRVLGALIVAIPITGSIYFGGEIGLPFLFAILWLVAAREMFDALKKGSKSSKLYCIPLLFLVAMSFVSLVFLRRNFGANYVMFFFLAVWANDIFALLVGKHGKMHFCSISPKKTIEGVLGGTVATALVAIFVARKIGVVTGDAYAICLCVIVLGLPGDLLFSWFKRRCKIKDYGCIIPGHGGIMDRFDSTILASIGAWLMLCYITHPH